MNSPISTRPSTPSDLFSTTQTKKTTLPILDHQIILPIFDHKKLPNWNNQQRQELEEAALEELRIRRDLASAIRSTKICLRISNLTEEQALSKLRDLWALHEMYAKTVSIVKRFENYLLEEYKPIADELRIDDPVRREMRGLIIQERLRIMKEQLRTTSLTEALNTSEQLTKSLTELHISSDLQETQSPHQNESA